MVAAVVPDAHVESVAAPASSARRGNAATATLAPLGAWIVLVVGSGIWGRHLLDDGVRLAISAPPLAGRFGWRVTPAALIPLAFGALVVLRLPAFADRVAWPRLLGLGMTLSALWALALSSIDGRRTFAAPFHSPAYLQTSWRIDDPHVFLSQFVARIGTYNNHTRAHPPGMELLLWLTARVGLNGVVWTSALALLGGAAAVTATLVALRDLAGERAARVALPFLVLAPGAIWWSSGDACFAGVAAWGVTLVVLATRSSGAAADRRALLGGVLFGIAAFLSYGLVLLAVIPVAVAAARRRWRPLALAALGAAPVFLAFGVAGFSWFAGLAATRRQYYFGAAAYRPYRYFFVADLAAFALALGPAAAVALARLRDRRVWLLVGGALVAVLLADVSGMSKAEVERIWLPFVPWVLLATVAVASSRGNGRVRGWLGLQAASAVLIAMAVRSPW